MESTFYEIDPNGDTLLILHNANAPFAVLPSLTPQKEQTKSDLSPDDQTVRERQDTDSESKDSESKPIWDLEDSDSGLDAGLDSDSDSEPTIRMRLSSKHLILASAYFQKLTANNWKETMLKDGYSYVINAHDWDEKALLTLMNIIHGRTAKVPRSFNLEMLAKIAVLVDYYQCHETVEFFSNTWLSSTSITIPKEGERDFMLRLVVSTVFSENFNFLLLTKAIIQNSKGPIDSLGLPIGGDIIDALNNKREDAITDVLRELRDLRKKLCRGPKGCTFECSSINLGAILKYMLRMRLVDPHPRHPYVGINLLGLEQGLRAIKEPSWKTNCLGLPPSQAASTKPAPAQVSNIFGGATSTTAILAAQSIITPAPATGLFNLNATPRTNVVSAPFQFGSHHAPAVARVVSPLPATKPVDSLVSSFSPTCSLSEKTKPIIEGLVSKLNGLRLIDYVKT